MIGARKLFLGLALLSIACDTGDGGPQITGKVTDNHGAPVLDAVVSAYGIVGRTDEDGSFALRGISSLPDRVVIQVEANGFFPNTSAVQNSGDGAPHLVVALTPKILVGSFDNASGGSIDGDGLSGSFEGDSFSGGGGEVNVYAGYISPDQDNFGSAMPGGDFFAQNGSNDDGVLTSFGAMQIAAEDQSGNDRQLTKEADVCLKIPSSMLSVAPDQMPLWTMGSNATWREAGFALRDGNRYCFYLTTLGSVNCDLFSRTAIIQGTVCNDDNEPVTDNAQVRIGQAITSTDSSGKYKAMVPSGQNLSVITDYGTEQVASLQASAVVTVDVNCEAAPEDPPDYGGPGSFCAYNYPESACNAICSTHASKADFSCRFVSGSGSGPCGSTKYDTEYDYGYSAGSGLGPVGSCILMLTR